MQERPNKYVRGLVTAGALATAGLAVETMSQAAARHEVQDFGTSEQGEAMKYRDNPEFDLVVPGGEFTPEERAMRTETIAPGIEIFHDIGLDFYHVQLGDTKASIAAALSELPQYAYLTKQKTRTVGFNIAEQSVHDVEWLPVPLRNADRLMTDENFLIDVRTGIEELIANDECYGEAAREIVEKIGADKFGVSLLAIAKMESGEHVGSSEFELYDAHNHTFSISPFHILNKGAGRRARKNLGKTIGQMNSLKNATQFIVGFLAEKLDDPAAVFPLDEHYELFATEYNGANWRAMNLNYAKDLDGYYRQALAKLDKN